MVSSQTKRMLVDFGPLLLFFTAYKISGIYAATVTVVLATMAAVGIGYLLDRKLAPVPLVTGILVAVLGGLTLILRDDTFIKMKPTFVYALLATGLIASEWIGKPLVKKILGSAIALKDGAWRALAFRFGGFFFVMALLNEAVWRNFSRDVWVNYHVFGAIALTFLFALSQAPYLMKHRVDDETPQPETTVKDP
jgi:intracellular septation protein